MGETPPPLCRGASVLSIASNASTLEMGQTPAELSSVAGHMCTGIYYTHGLVVEIGFDLYILYPSHVRML